MILLRLFWAIVAWAAKPQRADCAICGVPVQPSDCGEYEDCWSARQW